MTALLPEPSRRDVPTARLTASMLEIDGRAGEPVLLVPGNVSSSLFWQQLMVDLPAGVRPIAPDLREFGDTDRRRSTPPAGCATTATT